MTPEKLVLYEIKEAINQLPTADQVEVEVRAMTFRSILKGDGTKQYASLAFALVGAEMAAKASEITAKDCNSEWKFT